MNDFSARLERLMADRDIRQVALAREAGTTQTTISRLLRGQEPRAADLYRLARYFGVSMEWLYMGEEPERGAQRVAEEAATYGRAGRITAEGLERILSELDEFGDEMREVVEEIRREEGSTKPD